VKYENGGDEMLTDRQVAELKALMEKHKNSKESLRIADVTKVIYPVDKYKKQHKIKS
jgi:hypothetical protein